MSGVTCEILFFVNTKWSLRHERKLEFKESQNVFEKHNTISVS